MKKALILFFLLQFMGQQLFLQEWLKLPALFAHFREHRVEKHSFTNFTSFFRAHYGCSQHKYSEDHSQLPFQEKTACGQNIQLFFSVRDPVKIIQTSLLQKENLPAYRPSSKSTDVSAIWQPPR